MKTIFFQQQAKSVTVVEIGKNIESDVTELSRLRNTYLKNHMIGLQIIFRIKQLILGKFVIKLL